jgi:hypothetical protein
MHPCQSISRREPYQNGRAVEHTATTALAGWTVPMNRKMTFTPHTGGNVLTEDSMRYAIFADLQVKKIKPSIFEQRNPFSPRLSCFVVTEAGNGVKAIWNNCVCGRG